MTTVTACAASCTSPSSVTEPGVTPRSRSKSSDEPNDKKLIATFGVGTDFPKRVSFLINPDGVIIKIYHGFDAEKHALDIAKDLDVLGA
jgi:hypothetical protein